MKKIAFILPYMRGGGAERVAAQLADSFADNGTQVSVLLTHENRRQLKCTDLYDSIPTVLFSEDPAPQTLPQKAALAALRLSASLLCKPFELLKKPVPADFAMLSLRGEYGREIALLRRRLSADPTLTAIAFLQPAIPITILAAQGLKNRIVISERGNPIRLMTKRYGKKFIEKYYPRADRVVFQTDEAEQTYPLSVAQKGTVIPNPVKPDLPEPYFGERNKTVTTFCRISKQKNLLLLIDAYSRFHADHPDYRLRIIGDAFNEEGKRVLSSLHQRIAAYHLEDSVVFEPFKTGVHQAIMQDAMYINSSDYEGISNAMLEAMAIGMPVICTDCPIRGARAVIRDGENGLLVPVNDADAMYRAMKRVSDDRTLSQHLSKNASHIREELAVSVIAKKWEALL